jgi:hypothetical protein
MTKPFSPKEVLNAKNASIPDFVIDSVNELLVLHYYHNDTVQIYQREIVDQIIAKMKAIREYDANSAEEMRNMIFDRGWLNFEYKYKEAGWGVSYIKEFGDVAFVFSEV